MLGYAHCCAMHVAPGVGGGVGPQPVARRDRGGVVEGDARDELRHLHNIPCRNFANGWNGTPCLRRLHAHRRKERPLRPRPDGMDNAAMVCTLSGIDAARSCVSEGSSAMLYRKYAPPSARCRQSLQSRCSDATQAMVRVR